MEELVMLGTYGPHDQQLKELPKPGTRLYLLS